MPGQQEAWPDYPFCSPRCRKIDLGRWLGEQYGVGTPPDEEPEPDAAERDPSDD